MKRLSVVYINSTEKVLSTNVVRIYYDVIGTVVTGEITNEQSISWHVSVMWTHFIFSHKKQQTSPASLCRFSAAYHHRNTANTHANTHAFCSDVFTLQSSSSSRAHSYFPLSHCVGTRWVAQTARLWWPPIGPSRKPAQPVLFTCQSALSAGRRCVWL